MTALDSQDQNFIPDYRDMLASDELVNMINQ